MGTVTTEQLDEWERLADEATEGPWQVRQFPTASYARPQFWVLDSIPDRDGKVVANAICSATATNQDASENARFIAASRLAVPQLVAEVRRLRGELKLWKPMTPEEAEAAYAEAEAVPLAPGEVEAMAARIMARINDPTYRPTEPEHVRLVLENRRLRDENRALKLLNAIQKFDGDETVP